jgi:hypothetical protein
MTRILGSAIVTFGFGVERDEHLPFLVGSG